MKIQYASDLHLEFAENKSFIEHGGIEPVGDVLVLAGDVSYLADRKMWKRPFWDWCAEHFRETFVVPGNHEFYGGFDIGRTMGDYELEVRPNVRYLNNRSIVLGDTELFLTTLWTKIDPTRLWTVQQGMNDYRYCRLNGKSFFANDVDGLHGQCMEWLSGALAASTAAHKVVVTHHCPTMRQVFNGCPGGALNSAFQVDLDAFIETSGVGYWIYGHTHYAGGSGTKIGDTVLLCNQLGYVCYGEQKDYVKDAIIEVL
ncbi:MAG: metallophosphoesterase [Bacteroidales bacterium]|nr:metallophosphoesterase [Bacteroidales bacterium]MBR0256088.1 metallophosphoesterase [Bacteroidales bacterium]